MLPTLFKIIVETDCDVIKPKPALLNDQNMLICRWNCSFAESSTWQIKVPWLSFPHQTQTFTWPSWSARLSHPLSDGGEFPVEECLDVRPDLVGFCPRERLKHTFTPGEENSRTPCVKGTDHPKIKLSNHHYIKKEAACFLILPVELQDRLRLSFVGSQPPCDRLWRVIFPLEKRLPCDIVQSLQYTGTNLARESARSF